MTNKELRESYLARWKALDDEYYDIAIQIGFQVDSFLKLAEEYCPDSLQKFVDVCQREPRPTHIHLTLYQAKELLHVPDTTDVPRQPGKDVDRKANPGKHRPDSGGDADRPGSNG